MQRSLFIYFFRFSTCFRRFLCPLSRAHNCTYSFRCCQSILLLAAYCYHGWIHGSSKQHYWSWILVVVTRRIMIKFLSTYSLRKKLVRHCYCYLFGKLVGLCFHRLITDDFLWCEITSEVSVY